MNASAPTASPDRASTPAVVARTLLVLAALLATSGTVTFALGLWDPPYGSDLSLWRRLAPLAVTAAASVAVLWLPRILEDDTRRRAMRAGTSAVMAISFLAAVVPQPSPSGMGRVCVPLFDAWQQQVRLPAATDIAFFNSVHQPLTDLRAVADAGKREELFAKVAEAKATPQYRAANRYFASLAGPAPCAPPSRDRLLGSCAVFVIGLGGLALMFTRKRNGPAAT